MGVDITAYDRSLHTTGSLPSSFFGSFSDDVSTIWTLETGLYCSVEVDHRYTPWDPQETLAGLPPFIRMFFSLDALTLKTELEQNKLKVVLAEHWPGYRPKFEGHKIRKVESENPEWYQELYATVSHLRRDRSLLSLQRLVEGKDLPLARSGYDVHYRELIKDRLMEGYKMIDHRPREPNAFVQSYFARTLPVEFRILPVAARFYREGLSSEVEQLLLERLEELQSGSEREEDTDISLAEMTDRERPSPQESLDDVPF